MDGDDRQRELVATDAGAEAARSSAPPSAPRAPRRGRFAKLAFLAFGASVAIYLSTQGPKEQHVRVVLGPAAPLVTNVGVQYVGTDGELAREAHFAYRAGAAPRIVAHEPKLPNGEYRVQIDVGARDGRREISRQVTLGGGSTQIDVSSALAHDEERPMSPDRERAEDRPPNRE